MSDYLESLDAGVEGMEAACWQTEPEVFLPQLPSSETTEGEALQIRWKKIYFCCSLT